MENGARKMENGAGKMENGAGKMENGAGKMGSTGKLNVQILRHSSRLYPRPRPPMGLALSRNAICGGAGDCLRLAAISTGVTLITRHD